MRLLLKKGRVFDPDLNLDLEADVLVQEGRILRIEKGISDAHVDRCIDARGLLVTAGFVDLHSHLREPGEEHKEDFISSSESALAGGFTSVCAMPNTRPPNDSPSVTRLILSQTAKLGGVRVYPIGAITRGLQGEHLTDVGELKDCGVVALSDDGRPVMNSRLMRRALEYGRTFELPIIQHAEDLALSEGAVMNEGEVSTRLGLRGQPPQTESILVARDLALVELTGARYHVAHVSTRETVELVRSAKKRGLPVTCEVTPHHLLLTDTACLDYNTYAKVNPPLRSRQDQIALWEGLQDGTIDCIATDHAPHSRGDKEVQFDCAAFGSTGFETALSLGLELVEQKALSLERLIHSLTIAPARALKLPGGSLREDSVADLAVIDLEKQWSLEPSSFHSKSKNSPFLGRKLTGKVLFTVLRGSVAYEHRGDKRTSRQSEVRPRKEYSPSNAPQREQNTTEATP